MYYEEVATELKKRMVLSKSIHALMTECRDFIKLRGVKQNGPAKQFQYDTEALFNAHLFLYLNFC